MILIARQLQIPVVAVAIDDPDEPAPFLLAGQAGQEWYLFEPELGLALETETPGHVATWSELQANPGMVRQFDTEASPYPVPESAVTHLVVLIDATPPALSQRMYLLELALPSDAELILTVAPTALQTIVGTATRCAAHCHLDATVRRGEISAYGDSESYPGLIQQLGEEQLPLHLPWPLGIARHRHVTRGIGAGVDDDCRRLYMAVRLSESQISRIHSLESFQTFVAEFSDTLKKAGYDRDVAEAIESMFVAMTAAPLDDPRLMEALIGEIGRSISVTPSVLLMTRRDASMWLGLLSFEAGEYRVAADYFGKRVLSDEGTPWRESAACTTWAARAKRVGVPARVRN